MIWPDPTHQPTHQIIHPPMAGGVSTDFKSSNRIEICRLVQVLWNFEWFRGSPWGWGWVDVGGGGERVHPIHVHMHVHAHACMYDIIGNSQGFPQWGRPFAWNYHVYHEFMCVCVHVCMCACVCMCMCVGGKPNYPPPPSTHPTTPKSRRKPKTPKFNNSCTNWDNSILFEDSLPLNIPELI